MDSRSSPLQHAIAGCQVKKILVLNKSRLGVVPNSPLFSG
jgi:hypothetical protein